MIVNKVGCFLSDVCCTLSQSQVKVRGARFFKPNLFAIRRQHFVETKRIIRRYCSSKVPHSMRTALLKGRASYIRLHESTSAAKTNELLKFSVERTLGRLNVTNLAPTVSENWKLLKRRGGDLFPDFDKDDLSTNLRALHEWHDRPLIKGTRILLQPSQSEYISTPNEAYWSMPSNVGVPFSSAPETVSTDLSLIQDIADQFDDPQALIRRSVKLDSEEKKVQAYSLLGQRDAAAAILLAIPYIAENTFLHEVGCWNGQNLLNLLFHASTYGKSPKYCLGTDINAVALGMAESVSDLFSLRPPLVQFHLANVLYPTDASVLRLTFQNEIRLALRILPVLDPSDGKKFLHNVRRSIQGRDAIVIVSYAIPGGETFQKNRQGATDSSHSQFTEDVFSGGIIFRNKVSNKNLPKHLRGVGKPNFALNSYYTKEGFSALVNECGFKIQKSISVLDKDDDRVVALLSVDD